MAYQMGVVTGNKRLRPNQLADLNARLSYLPQTMAAESEAAYQKAQISNMEETNKINQQKLGLDTERLGLETKRFGLDEQRFGLDEKGLALQEQSAAFGQKATQKGLDLKERSEAMQTGVSAAGLGFNLFGKDFGTLGSNLSKVGIGIGTGSGEKQPYVPGGVGQVKESGGFWSDMPIASSLAGGLAGFGASRMVPTKNKFAKVGIGAGVGALTGFFGGGGAGGAIGGGLLGGLGGLF